MNPINLRWRMTGTASSMTKGNDTVWSYHRFLTSPPWWIVMSQIYSFLGKDQSLP